MFVSTIHGRVDMWEYTTLVTYLRHPYLSTLNEYGKQGWEIFHIKELANDNLLFFFRRELREYRLA